MLGVPGQPEQRLARFPYSKPVAAARLPWSLADQPQNRNEPQLNRALHALSPFDPVLRDRLSPIGARSARLRLIDS